MRTAPPEGSLLPPDPVDLLRHRYVGAPTPTSKYTVFDQALTALSVCRDRADRLAQELAEKKGELAVAYGSGGSAEETEWFSALDKAKAEVAAERDRADRAERERDEAVKLLRQVAEAEEQDRAMGYPLPGESCVYVAITLAVDPFLASVAAGSVEGRDD